MDPTPTEIVHTAIDELLFAVAKSSDDLRAFHGAVSKARIAPLPPFPRATLIVARRIVDDLERVEHDLREVLVALGLTR